MQKACLFAAGLSSGFLLGYVFAHFTSSSRTEIKINVEEKTVKEKTVVDKNLEEKTVVDKNLEEKTVVDKNLEEKTVEDKNLGEKNVEEKKKKKKQKKKVGFADQLVTLLGDDTNREEKEKKTESLKEKAEDSNDVSKLGFGKMGFINNYGVSCYANSTVQCLFSLDQTLLDALEEEKGEVALELKRLTESSTKMVESAKTLRALVSKEFANNVQHSMCEFWETLMNRLDEEAGKPTKLSQLFAHSEIRFHRCLKCSWFELQNSLEGTPACYFQIPGVTNPDEPTKEEILDSDISLEMVLNQLVLGRTCPNGHPIRESTVFKKTSRFLALNLERRAKFNKINRKIIRFNPNSILLMKSEEGKVEDGYYDKLEKFRAIAVVIHEGLDFKTGHYFVYRRSSEGSWYVCNDVQIKKVESKEMKFADMTFLLLEKVEDFSG